jgi:hypothetical protein
MSLWALNQIHHVCWCLGMLNLPWFSNILSFFCVLLSKCNLILIRSLQGFIGVVRVVSAVNTIIIVHILWFCGSLQHKLSRAHKNPSSVKKQMFLDKNPSSVLGFRDESLFTYVSDFYAPNHKMSQALCHGLCIGVRKHLVSVNYRTNAWVDSNDWSDFSVAYWGWLEEGSFRWSAPPLIQDGHYGSHLGFGFRRLQDKRLGQLIWFFLCGSLGVTGGWFLSMISSATHPSLSFKF